MSTADSVLAVARTQLGKFYPGNSPYGIWYGDKVGSSVYDNAQFCAMGLSWCASKAGALDIIPLHAYTPSGAAWFKARNQWVTKSPRKGDLAYFDFPDEPYRISHVGIVERVYSDGTMDLLEFNTSSTVHGSQRNGRTVARKRRSMRYVVGLGRPAYSAPKPPAKPKPTVKKIGTDGYFGSETIRRTQTVLGMEADGIVSGQARSNDRLELTSGWEWKSDSAALRGGGSAMITNLQLKLKAKGLYKGEIDGLAGPLFWAAFRAALKQKTTKGAVAQFQHNLNEGKLW